jgi:hypothetical protein
MVSPFYNEAEEDEDAERGGVDQQQLDDESDGYQQVHDFQCSRRRCKRLLWFVLPDAVSPRNCAQSPSHQQRSRSSRSCVELATSVNTSPTVGAYLQQQAELWHAASQVHSLQVQVRSYCPHNVVRWLLHCVAGAVCSVLCKLNETFTHNVLC